MLIAICHSTVSFIDSFKKRNPHYQFVEYSASKITQVLSNSLVILEKEETFGTWISPNWRYSLFPVVVYDINNTPY